MKEIPTKVITADLSSLIKTSTEKTNNQGLNRFGREAFTNPVNQHKGQRPNNPAYTDVVVKAMKGK